MSGQEKPTLRRNILTPFENIGTPPHGFGNHNNITTGAAGKVDEVNRLETADITADMTDEHGNHLPQTSHSRLHFTQCVSFMNL